MSIQGDTPKEGTYGHASKSSREKKQGRKEGRKEDRDIKKRREGKKGCSKDQQRDKAS